MPNNTKIPQTTHIERVIASRPANRSAAMVTGRGVHWEPNKKITQAHHDAPPPTRPVPTNQTDLTGRTFGRFRVFGFLAIGDGKGKGQLWLVRCTCGYYEERRTRAVVNPNNQYDCCAKCQHLRFIKKREHFDRTGQDRPLEDFM